MVNGGLMKMADLEQTLKKLEKEATAARPGNMAVAKSLLYSNKDTGTAVYEVVTNNMPIILANKGHGEYITWSYYLVGNEAGFAYSTLTVKSESCVALGEIAETESNVIIPQRGYKTVHFGIQIPVEDVVFRKDDFKPYKK